MQKLISTDFKNWKKACERFALHTWSQNSIDTTNEIISVDVQLSNVKASQQKEARTYLLKMISAVQLLPRQGLALRGHDDTEGNFAQFLKYKS